MTKDNSSWFVGSGIGDDTSGLMLNSNTSKKKKGNNNNLLNTVNKRSEKTLTPNKNLTFQKQTNKHKIMVGMQGYSPTSRNNHPKCKDWVVAYRRWLFTRIEPKGAFSKKRSRHIHFMEDNYCMQCLSNDMCSSMFSLKFFIYSGNMLKAGK